MKKLFLMFTVAIVTAFGLMAGASAQVYPSTNPTYTPNMRVPAFAIASGVANTAQILNSVGTTAIQISGTCTSLNGRLEGSVNGTNWVTLNLYPHDATVAASAVTSVGATGIWEANTSGLNRIRFNNSAVSGSACVGTLSGSSNAFTLPR